MIREHFQRDLDDSRNPDPVRDLVLWRLPGRWPAAKKLTIFR